MARLVRRLTTLPESAGWNHPPSLANYQLPIHHCTKCPIIQCSNIPAYCYTLAPIHQLDIPIRYRLRLCRPSSGGFTPPPGAPSSSGPRPGACWPCRPNPPSWPVISPTWSRRANSRRPPSSSTSRHSSHWVIFSWTEVTLIVCPPVLYAVLKATDGGLKCSAVSDPGPCSRS